MLLQREYLKDDKTQGYPWTRVVETERGKLWRAGRLIACRNCKGEGGKVKTIKGEMHMLKCVPCDGTGDIIT